MTKVQEKTVDKITVDNSPAQPADELPSKAMWYLQPDQLASNARYVLSYLGRVAAEVGEDGYSEDCVQQFGWMIRRMVRALETADECRVSPLEHVEFELEHLTQHPVDALNEARACITIVREHHSYSTEEFCAQPTDEEHRGLALMMEMVLLYLEDAESKITVLPKEVAHVAE